MSKPYYADLGDWDEDKRIEAIGNAATPGKIIAFVTDAEPGKADRYIAKLKERFPGIAVVERFDGPIEDTVTVKVRRSEA